jgi:hypothetical protein
MTLEHVKGFTPEVQPNLTSTTCDGSDSPSELNPSIPRNALLG